MCIQTTADRIQIQIRVLTNKVGTDIPPPVKESALRIAAVAVILM